MAKKLFSSHRVKKAQEELWQMQVSSCRKYESHTHIIPRPISDICLRRILISIWKDWKFFSQTLSRIISVIAKHEAIQQKKSDSIFLISPLSSSFSLISSSSWEKWSKLSLSNFSDAKSHEIYSPTSRWSMRRRSYRMNENSFSVSVIAHESSMGKTRLISRSSMIRATQAWCSYHTISWGSYRSHSLHTSWSRSKHTLSEQNHKVDSIFSHG